MPDDSQIHGAMEKYANRVGVILLEHWEFDSDIIEVARSRGDWWRNPQPYPDLADVVLIARIHASIGRMKITELPPINKVPAFSKLPLGELCPDTSLQVLREAEATVQDVMQMLGV